MSIVFFGNHPAQQIVLMIVLNVINKIRWTGDSS